MDSDEPGCEKNEGLILNSDLRKDLINCFE
jgi:hypothetical protein